MDKQPLPETMLEAVRQFSDPQVAHDFFVQIRFPHGVACPRHGCGGAKVAYLAKVRRWYCNDCKRQFSAKVGTIFEDSPIGLDKWLPAIWLISSNRNGISSYEIARALNVTQKTAWFMLHRIREGLRDETFEKLSGDVEADETHVGAKFNARQDHHGRGKRKLKPKATVMGVAERGGKVRAWVVPDARTVTLYMRLRDNVEPGSTLYTDAWKGYDAASQRWIRHVIDHAHEYVRGHVHTNNIEGFWSVFKRMIKGTYIAPRPKHLQRYVEEEVFRFNERGESDGPRFAKATKGADGKRLTYKELIAR